MADDADMAQAQGEREWELRQQALRYELPQGVAGECDLCGEWSGRLVGGVCAPCRDRHGLE